MTDPAHDAYAALRSANYRRYVAGWFISTTGLGMQQVAIGWELYERTGSAIGLGYIGLAQALPVIFLALPGGHAADLYNRRKLVIATQILFAICSAGLAAVSFAKAPVGLLYALLACAGGAKAFNSPARGALFPLIVDEAHFQNAVSWNTLAFHLAATAGPALGGWVIAWSGAAWPVYAAASAGTLVFATSLGFVQIRATKKRAEGGNFSLESMTGGLAHLWSEKTVLAAITLDLFAVLLGGATTLLPIYAKDILHVDARGLGMLRAAPYIGASLMAIALAHQPPLRRAGPAFLGAVAGFGVATIVFGLSKSFWLSMVMLAVSGGLDSISVVVRHVLVQLRTPDAIRGRVTAVNSIFIESSNELGGFESGLVAQFFGPVVSVVAGGIGTILVVIGVAAIWPPIRKLGRIQAKPDPEAEISA